MEPAAAPAGQALTPWWCGSAAYYMQPAPCPLRCAGRWRGPGTTAACAGGCSATRAPPSSCCCLRSSARASRSAAALPAPPSWSRCSLCWQACPPNAPCVHHREHGVCDHGMWDCCVPLRHRACTTVSTICVTTACGTAVRACGRGQAGCSAACWSALVKTPMQEPLHHLRGGAARVQAPSAARCSRPCTTCLTTAWRAPG